jgi:hypothetical protein
MVWQVIHTHVRGLLSLRQCSEMPSTPAIVTLKCDNLAPMPGVIQNARTGLAGCEIVTAR